MTIQTSLGRTSLRRRGFLVSGAAVAGGFSLGFSFPFEAAHAAEVKEINAWVVIHPDDKVVIRIARSEMGQGTLTGLAQLVAEELECDWNKVTWEYPTPGENLRRNRVLEELLDRRQPRHPREQPVCPRRRRHGARDADRGGGGRVEGAGDPNAARPTASSPTSRARSSATARSPRRRPSSSRPRK